MKEILIDELKEIELEMMEKIHDLCVSNNLRYALGYGTLIGAVRHKGFIPWDDDIDIIMPRPDYDKLVEILNSNELRYCIRSCETNKNYGDMMAKIYDSQTLIWDENVVQMDDMGIYIDVIPIDGMGNDSIIEAVKNFNATRFKRELLIATTWKKYFRSKTKPLYIEPFRLFFFIISRFVKPSKLIKSIKRRYEHFDFDNVDYAGALASAYRSKDVMKKNIYSELCCTEFEGKEFYGLKNYDAYLRQLYGDYMKLPPKDKQVSHHTFKAFWREK